MGNSTGGGSGVGTGHGTAANSGGSPGGYSVEGSGQGGGLPGAGGFAGRVKAGSWNSGSSGSFMELVEASVQRSLLEEKGNPQKSY
jgi:hypothetical protein